ncbi:MAG TPA: alpha/beta-hydrolase family protein [Amaricoccus sp.]|uniref:alpha/beta hydrolase n=1 Tax=Amaricoccus sp. TaxID=1872485 RepID=UPI002C758617|nr:alpha/beta-hydrolase family protein [Amaricoccus sp.]HMQ93419.1 alpha/beta-hydrolase family protein [Amaricoccus sp.]HMR52762.1 alpha/beta-hydrolase family protein [Amaricoccus sp.]HMR60932.1 alpha/beta-hydrolase family protein [Amaricoccus sp.]HMT99696.1 alpha/beta-hydrolase family protein [Amaricoccus sp.]
MPYFRMGALLRSLSLIGLPLGAIFLAASLTPSLIPRSYLMQGALAGVSLALGYAIGTRIDALWRYLELPVPGPRWGFRLTWASLGVAAAIVLAALWKSAAWQNSIRELMGMPPVETIHPLEVGLVALAVFAVLLVIWRFFRMLAGYFDRWTGRFVPGRVARIIGVAAAGALFVLILDGLLLRSLLGMADEAMRIRDSLIEPDVARPEAPERTGSAASLVDWAGMGRTGRDYVSSGPTAAEISAFLGRPALEPIRVYVGLNSAEDAEARADLALRELERVGAFERSALIVVVPTGTGWMDSAGTDPVEYLLGGDVATVAIQYSYLTSPMSLLVEPGIGIEAGRALFRAVYRHWTELPRDERPKLYLNGLSLGAYSSEQSVRLHEVIADPPQGALWVGPPFPSPVWRAAVRDRNPGTPEWLPRFGDGSILRFTNQENALDIPGAEWGPIRLVYLQYPSDPITFFSPESFYREPDWMKAPRGPDVSPDLMWFPGVSFLQLLLDTAIGLNVPMGHGHLFAPEHYIDGWQAVVAPEGWDAEGIERLKAHFREKFAAEAAEG